MGHPHQDKLDSIMNCLKVLCGIKLQNFVNELSDGDEIDEVSRTVS